MASSRATTRQTVGSLDTDLILEGGASVYIGTFLVANSSGAGYLIEIQNTDGVTKTWIFAPANDTEGVSIETLYDGGVVVKSVADANVKVTICHSSGGA